MKLTVVAECLSLCLSKITRIWDSSELVAKGIPAFGSPEVPLGSVCGRQGNHVALLETSATCSHPMPQVVKVPGYGGHEPPLYTQDLWLPFVVHPLGACGLLHRRKALSFYATLAVHTYPPFLSIRAISSALCTSSQA